MAVNATANIEITGAKELQRKLKRLPDKLARKVSGQATRAAMTPIRKAIRKNAPVGPTGNLKRSTFTRLKRYQQGQYFLATVGPKWPLGAHGHLIEFGTVNQPPRPYVRPIWDQMHTQAESELGRQLGNRIEKEAAKR